MGYGRQKWHSFFSTIGRHLECAIQTELVVELELALIVMMMFDSKPRQILYTVIILSADNGLYDC